MQPELFPIYFFSHIFFNAETSLFKSYPKNLQMYFFLLGGKVAPVSHLETKKLHFTLVSLI